MAWGFAMVRHRDDEAFATLARAAERRLSELNAQDIANTAWAFAIASHRDDKLLAARRERRSGG